MVAGVGRWRRRHVVPTGATALSAAEVAGLMRTVLPLVTLPGHPGKSLELGIVSADGEEEMVWGKIGAGGEVISCLGRPAGIDGSARGTATAWIDSVLDGPQEEISESGDAPLLAECLQRLHAVLWEERRPRAVDPTATASAR
jgi:hypothetical protein